MPLPRERRAAGPPLHVHPSNVEYDHLISLELGGAPNSLRNLWPEPHHAELNGRRARTIIRTDWRKAP